MALIFSGLALAFILLATGGSVVYIIRQQKLVYIWSSRVLLAGFFFLTISLVKQYYDLGVIPVFSLKSSLLFFTWIIVSMYFIFQLRFKLMVLGSFLTPLAATLMIISFCSPTTDIVVRPLLTSIWLLVHVTTVFIGDGIFAITFMASIMYLIQEHHIKKKKRGSFYKRLPSLESLDSVCRYSLMWGFPFLTVGMIIGVIYAQHVLGSYWRWDPQEVWSLITWFSYAILLHQRLAVGWRGRKAAIISIICFMILIFTFIGGSMWLSDYHSFKSLKGNV